MHTNMFAYTQLTTLPLLPAHDLFEQWYADENEMEELSVIAVEVLRRLLEEGVVVLMEETGLIFCSSPYIDPNLTSLPDVAPSAFTFLFLTDGGVR